MNSGKRSESSCTEIQKSDCVGEDTRTTSASALTTVEKRECWRCFIVLRGPSDTRQGICPRCGVDLDLIVECGEESPEQREDRKKWIAALDLEKIWTNWVNGYGRLMVERQDPDYSLVHEFATEVMEYSFPYIQRLKLPQDCMSYLRQVLNNLTESLLSTCYQLEDIQRLTGQWSDRDEENKRDWLKQLGFTNKLLGFTTKAPRKQIESM